MSDDSRPLLAYAHASEGVRVEAVCGAQTHRIGVGKVSAAVSLARALEELKPPWVLAFGVCGAYPESGLAVGELCLVGEDSLADEGVAVPEGFLSLTDLDIGDDTLWLADPARTDAVRAVLGEIPVVRGSTVSTCSGTDDLSRERRERTRASVETMEGASIAAVCAAWGVPWVGLRAVGNMTGDRDRAAFAMAAACDRVQDAVLQLVERGVL